MKSAAPRATIDKADAPAAGQGVAMVDNRAVAVAQRQALAAIDSSPRQVAQRQQAAAAATPRNTTGLPDNLKAGVENLSGYSLDDVTVHYNSAKPAQLQAHAYAQGTDIHVAPGQEKHLPHEAWHVVQQKQGRVRATMQMKGIGINDAVSLEAEATVMGRRAMQRQSLAPKLLAKKENGVAQLQVGRRNAAILNNNNISTYFTNDFVARHVVNSVKEAVALAKHRKSSGISYSHSIDRASLPAIINEVKARRKNGYYADANNKVPAPAGGPNQFHSDCVVKIYEIKYNGRGEVKKPKTLNTTFHYDAPLFNDSYAIHHFGGI